MESVRIIQKVEMDCPICGNSHEVEERLCKSSILIKGEKVFYEERYFYCVNEEDENEFTTGEMENANLMSARNAYRINHNLLTSDEIVEIRKKYGLSQIDLAKLLGWGEATISRYESKAIQDDAYDNMLKIIRDNPVITLDFLLKNENHFSKDKKMEIQNRIEYQIHEYGREYLQRKSLESEYIAFKTPCNENGYSILDIDKIEAIISYFAEKIPNLYRTKLMKLLWYADSLNYKINKRSITGLIYSNETMGATPLGYKKIIALDKIKTEEIEGFEGSNILFMPNERIDYACLSNNEIKVLECVVGQFRDYSTKKMFEYMKQEVPFRMTKEKEYILYSLAKEIKEF